MRSSLLRAPALCIVLALCLGATAVATETTGRNDGARPGLVLESTGAGYALSLDGGAPFHRTGNEILEQRLVAVPGSPTRLVLWSEALPGGGSAPHYAISLDDGDVQTVRRTSYEIKLRHGEFDPLAASATIEPSLAAAEGVNLHLVQFVTQPLEEFRTTIESMGGKVHKFLPGHAHYVQMSPAVRDAVAALPFVRWVGPVHPAYKLEEEIQGQIVSEMEIDPRRYSIMLNRRGADAQKPVATYIESIGGEVHGATPQGFRLEASLTLDQVRQLAELDDVMFIDRKSKLELDMDIVREIGGANYLETIAGYTGQGVRAEVCDSELDEDHPEWSAPPIIHVAGAGTLHGTSVYGILFGRGADPQARGLIPDGVGIFAYSSGLLGGGPTRYSHTAELVDPEGAYRTVLQTNSTGDARTTAYTTISAEMDDILFTYDIAITQSQSNAGNRDSRPQAWAKNIISGGAVYHYDTPTRDDDCWCSGASIGPASDGRIKPDLCFFYDDTYTASSGGVYTQFGGTSGATPSIAGYLGLFFQMWSEGIFGNDLPVPGGSVFENRPHMTTAKAVMINTASQYPFSGSGHDLTRVHQGWGMPDIRNLYDMRDNISVIDETELVGNLESAEFVVYVEPGEPALRVTMVYADPMGSPTASVHRINDLSLRLTSPTGTTYWGNNGLLEGNWSVAGGSANTVDTVENVFVQNPESGVWSVTVIASEINEDGHVETPELDADFALVASGGFLATCTSDGRIQLDSALYACSDQAAIRVVDCDLNTSDTVIDTVTVTIDSTSEAGGESVILTETAAETSDFRGTIPLSATDAPGVLLIAEGDLVTATYIDADDGQGGINVTVTDVASVDCAGPVVSNVQTVNVQARWATVTFDTDESASGTVHYGTSCATLASSVNVAGYTTSHQIDLVELQENSTYYYAVEAEDEAGNVGTDDNAGACYTFNTPDIPDYFTELFPTNDLDNLSLTFTPDGSNDFYSGCTQPITSLPIDPAGGTTLSLTDDGNAAINLGGGQTVSLYDTTFSTFYVGANGYVTFNNSDGTYSETLASHFDRPRISALFDDLNPSSVGTVSWKQMADRAVITWQNVPEYGTSTSNTFQIEMHFNGVIVISFLDLAAADGLAGLSAGNGLPPDFYESDLSIMVCGPTCNDGILNQGEALIDCGGPCPPCQCTTNGECDDAEFCNGAESCDGYGDCQVGTDPCLAGELCDEANDICVAPYCDNDGSCEFGEDCTTCGADCFTGAGASCGNGVCEAADGENCVNCVADCAGRSTGKPSGRFCCGYDAANAVGCGNAACNSGGLTCTETSAEVSCCGDFICEGAEDSYNCAVDCGLPPICGDGFCHFEENQCICPEDCGNPPAIETACKDGVDEDCDGFADCADSDCDTDPACSCFPRGALCGTDAQCCSNRCHRNVCK